MKNKFSKLFRYCPFCKNNKWLKSRVAGKYVGHKTYFCKNCNIEFNKCSATHFSVAIAINRFRGYYCYFYNKDNNQYRWKDSAGNVAQFSIKTNPIDIFNYAVRVIKNRNLM